MTLRDRIQARLVLCRISVDVAQKAIYKAEKEAKKDGHPVPRLLMDKLVAEVEARKLECFSIEASLMGVSRFPPVI